MQRRTLTASESQLLADERIALSTLRDILVRLHASPANRGALARSIEQLDELFLLVVVGEFNSGKSAFINALIGQRVLKEGVTPTTAQVNILQYGDAAEREVTGPQLHVVTAPIDLLRDIHVVDTPGTNAVIREHETITADFVPRADLVLFVTSADRPFTESERLFLESIRNWGKKVVIVINKTDLFERDEELAEVVAFVGQHAQQLLGSRPEIFPVSARLAMRAKEGDDALLGPSRFAALEEYIRAKLDEGERLRLKLANPLGVGVNLATRYLQVVDEQIALLSDDLRLLEDVERQLAAYRDDMARQFTSRMAEIENVLHGMEHRGHAFFDEMLRLARVFDLLNKSRVQEGFEREVVADAPRHVEQRVSELIDWMVASDLRQWQRVTSQLAERRRQHRDRIVGDADMAGFDVERGRLLDSVGREAQRVVDSYDRRGEAALLADNARNAVATAAAVGAGALGLGAIVTIAATSAAADITGLIAAGVMATLGFFVIPARRRRAKAEMRDKITRMRETLERAMRSEFEQALRRGETRINDAVAPYSRFVRTEHQALETSRVELTTVSDQLVALRERIGALAAS